MRFSVQFRSWMILGVVVMLLAPTALAFAGCRSAAATHKCCGPREGYRQPFTPAPCCNVSAAHPAPLLTVVSTTVSAPAVAHHTHSAVQTSTLAPLSAPQAITPSPPLCSSVLRI